ncbi:MAG: 50S ribosomal protein L28 [Bacillota bacterium]
MANRCEICQKTMQNGNLVSHSNIKTHRVWKSNIHKIKTTIKGAPKRIKICTRCLRSGKIDKA